MSKIHSQAVRIAGAADLHPGSIINTSLASYIHLETAKPTAVVWIWFAPGTCVNDLVLSAVLSEAVDLRSQGPVGSG